MEFLTVPDRTQGKRSFGLTSIADFGIPIGLLRTYLEDYHHIIDIAKIGIGSAYVTPNLKEKITLYNQYNVIPYFGGTLFEKSFYQNKLPEYVKQLKALGITWIEISEGTLNIPLEKRLSLIRELKDDFSIIGEVGSKDTEKEMPLSEWIFEINKLLSIGCKYVITEGRDSASAGIYHKDGKIKTALIEEITKAVDISKIIFEAPTAKSQMYFINTFGANVNLGNVKIQDSLTLEAQRCGLRSETFYLEETQCKLPL